MKSKLLTFSFLHLPSISAIFQLVLDTLWWVGVCVCVCVCVLCFWGFLFFHSKFIPFPFKIFVSKISQNTQYLGYGHFDNNNLHIPIIWTFVHIGKKKPKSGIVFCFYSEWTGSGLNNLINCFKYISSFITDVECPFIQ